MRMESPWAVPPGREGISRSVVVSLPRTLSSPGLGSCHDVDFLPSCAFSRVMCWEAGLVQKLCHELDF